MDYNSKAALISTNIPRRFTLHSSLRSFIFFILFLSIIASNLTKGIFISSSSIKTALSLDDLFYGIFASLYSVGKVLGTLLLMYLINKVHRKWLIIISILITSVLLSVFKFTVNKFILMSVYCLIGMTSMTIIVYIPIWIDQFAMAKYKSIFLTLIQFGEAFGLALGYILNYLIGDEKFQLQFLINGGVLFILAMTLLPISNLYFSSRVLILNEVNGSEQVNIKEDNENINEHNSVISLFRIRQSNESTFELDFMSKIKTIMSSPLFICSLISSTILLTTMTVITYWIIDYIKTVFKVEDQQKALVSYILITISGPIGGLFTSVIVSITIGNYNHRHAGTIMFLMYFLATLVANQIYLVNDYLLFVAITILYLMLCSTALPMIQGISLGSVSQSLKGTAFSLANFFINIFGVIPSTYAYGYINNKYKEKNNRLAMNCMMKYLIGGAVLAFVTMIVRCRDNRRAKNVFRESIEMKRDSEIKEGTELQEGSAKVTEEKLDDSSNKGSKNNNEAN